MSKESLGAQVEWILDQTTDRTVSVIVEAPEPDPAVRALATTVARAVGERRLTADPAEIDYDMRASLSGHNSRRTRRGTPSVAAAAMASAEPDTSKTAARSALRPVLGLDAVRAAAARGGEESQTVTPLPVARSVAATLTRDELASVRGETQRVGGVYLNRALRVPPVVEVKALPKAVTETRAAAWGVERVGALAAWGAYNARGRNVKVGVLDTGVDATHPDLDGKIAHWAEFDGQGNEVAGSTPHDSDRHGTHVCGTIAGGNASGKWIGVSPAARLAVGLVLNGEQGGTDAQVLAGLGWALDRGVHVISMSLGGLVIGPETPGTYTRAILECFLRGVPVVAAIGNDGSETSGSPGNDLFAVAVGATDIDDGVAAFSGGRTQVITQSTVIRGDFLPLPYPKPDVSAPGVAVESSVPGGQWTAFSGTSMATPHTSGVLALLLSATGHLHAVAPKDRVGVILDLLAGSVYELGENGQDHRYGFGRVDALRAIGLAKDRSL
jgi:subtilisin family serine protease